MRTLRSAAATVVATTALGAGLLLPAGSASAETSGGDARPASQVQQTGEGTADAAGWGHKVKTKRLPKCIKARAKTSGFTDVLKVRNRCSRTYHVKAVIDRHADSKCQKLRPGYVWTLKWEYPGNINHVKRCR